MFQIGLSTCGKAIDDAFFSECRKSGIAALEISVAHDKYDELDYRTMQILSEKYGVALASYHLPFGNTDISRADMAEASVARHRELIGLAAEIGIKTFVVHPSGEPVEDGERSERMNRSKESLIKLAEIARREGAVIAVEDLPRSCLGRNSDELLDLISVDEKLRVCFDTNHLLKEDINTFVRAVGNKIITTHISDYDFIDEKHWLPGEGGIDWYALAAVLQEVGYKGTWMYELGFGSPRTRKRERDLTCADFVRNAVEIFSREKLTVIPQMQ